MLEIVRHGSPRQSPKQSPKPCNHLGSPCMTRIKIDKSDESLATTPNGQWGSETLSAEIKEIQRQPRRNGKAQNSNPNEDRRGTNFIGPTGLWETEYFHPDLPGRLATRNHVEEKSTSWGFSFASATLHITSHLKIQFWKALQRLDQFTG